MNDQFLNKVILDSYSDPLSVFKSFSNESVDCVITSPPYWGLRNYNDVKKAWNDSWRGQLGQEPTPDLYVTHLCDIFDEMKRILKPSGTCWVNIGDSYDNNELSGVPFRFALEMINRGWILRNTIIWHKPKIMPSSTKDRFTVDFEYVFFFVKTLDYYFEMQYEPLCEVSIKRVEYGWHNRKGDCEGRNQPNDTEKMGKRWVNPELGRHKRCIWSIANKGYKGAHFAVFPEELVEIPLKAGCPVNGIVIDPFFGSGTVGVVAIRLSRNFIGIDCVSDYCLMAKERIGNTEIIELKK